MANQNAQGCLSQTNKRETIIDLKKKRKSKRAIFVEKDFKYLIFIHILFTIC